MGRDYTLRFNEQPITGFGRFTSRPDVTYNDGKLKVREGIGNSDEINVSLGRGCDYSSICGVVADIRDYLAQRLGDIPVKLKLDLSGLRNPEELKGLDVDVLAEIYLRRELRRAA